MIGESKEERRRLRRFAARYGKPSPKADETLCCNGQWMLTCYRLPKQHWERALAA
ncbi:MAG: hypothetical protein ACHQ9S_13205 [Candidatus Binatia bacterium]